MTQAEIESLIDDLDGDEREELGAYLADLRAAEEIEAFKPGPKKKSKPVEQPAEADDEVDDVPTPRRRQQKAEQAAAPDPRIIEDGDDRLNDVTWTIKNRDKMVASAEAKLQRHNDHFLALYHERERRAAAEAKAALNREKALTEFLETPMGRALSALG